LQRKRKISRVSERAITETENNKERERNQKKVARAVASAGPAVLDALEKELQKDDVQNDIQSQRDGSDNDRRLGVPRGIERRDRSAWTEARAGSSDGIIEKSAGGQARGFRDELAVLEEHADDRFAQNSSGRERQEW